MKNVYNQLKKESGHKKSQQKSICLILTVLHGFGGVSFVNLLPPGTRMHASNLYLNNLHIVLEANACRYIIQFGKSL